MQIITKQVKLTWQNPYVTDGLLAMWDGRWNAPGGVHDCNSTNIFELVSGKNEVLEGTITAHLDYYQTETVMVRSDTTLIGTALKKAIEGGSAHVEAILRPPTSFQAAFGNVFGTCGGSFGYQQATGAGGINLLGTGWISAKDTALIGSDFARLMFDIDVANLTLTYFVGSATVTGMITIPETITENAYLYVAGTRLYTVRIYNRPLSDAERDANLTIDRLRFTEN